MSSRFNHQNLHHYQALKQTYPDTVLFFQAWLGEHHLIEVDALLAVKVMNCRMHFAFMTKTAFVSIPTEALDKYIWRMRRAGHRVAVIRVDGKTRAPIIERMEPASPEAQWVKKEVLG